jgi:inner membrane protease subunit 2
MVTSQFQKLKPGFKYGYKITLGMISWIPVVMVFNEHVCYVGKIEGSSMRPTLNPSSLKQHDWVLLWKYGVKSAQNIKINDVVLFKSPENPNKILCKRVKGIQGDCIQTRYPYPRELCNVPRSHLWVEGDNIHSIDSNNFGPVSTGLVIGVATRVIWPLDRWMAVPTGGREARVSSTALRAAT